MKRLAFIDHSFHKATRSSSFLTELLRLEYEVSVFLDGSWSGGAGIDISTINNLHFDAIVFFQVLPTAGEVIQLKCENVTWVPMYDRESERADVAWYMLSLLGVKVICLSKVLFNTARRFGMKTYYAQYFPAPAAQTSSYDRIKLFFWQRVSEINWALVAQIVGKNQIANTILKADPDPTFSFEEPKATDIERYRIEIVRDLKVATGAGQEKYWDLLTRSNVYIAPRAKEGIGLSFLEAMSMGMCVVAPNAPTMNEYISDGKEGLLYELDKPKELDLSSFAECGRRAYAKVVAGRKQWEESIPGIIMFIAEPIVRKYSYWSTALLLTFDFARYVKSKMAPLAARPGGSTAGRSTAH